jgi:hypothetical protein
MKVEVKALRDLPVSENGDDVRHVRAGDTFTINLSLARVWRDSGKVSFDDPKEQTAPKRRRPAKPSGKAPQAPAEAPSSEPASKDAEPGDDATA